MKRGGSWVLYGFVTLCSEGCFALVHVGLPLKDSKRPTAPNNRRSKVRILLEADAEVIKDLPCCGCSCCLFTLVC